MKTAVQEKLAYNGGADFIWEHSLLQGSDLGAGTLRLVRVSRWGAFVEEERDSDVGRAGMEAMQWVKARHSRCWEASVGGVGVLDRWAVGQGATAVVNRGRGLWCVCVCTRTHIYMLYTYILYIFAVVQLLSCVWLFVTPWVVTAARQAPLSFTVSWSLLKFMSIESMIPSNHLILCHPLLLPFPASGSFSMRQLFASNGQSIGQYVHIIYTL